MSAEARLNRVSQPRPTWRVRKTDRSTPAAQPNCVACRSTTAVPVTGDSSNGNTSSPTVIPATSIVTS